HRPYPMITPQQGRAAQHELQSKLHEVRRQRFPVNQVATATVLYSSSPCLALQCIRNTPCAYAARLKTDSIVRRDLALLYYQPAHKVKQRLIDVAAAMSTDRKSTRLNS